MKPRPRARRLIEDAVHGGEHVLGGIRFSLTTPAKSLTIAWLLAATRELAGMARYMTDDVANRVGAELIKGCA